MTRMDRVDDVMLMAYVDGEVDAATAREIEAAIAADPAVAARVQRLRNSTVLARAAFADALHEPVPERLLAVFGATAAIAPASAAAPVAGPEKIVPLARRRTTSPSRTLIGWAMAASVAALVVGYGAGTWRLTTPEPAGLQNASLSDRWLDNIAGYYNVYANSLATKDKLLVDFNAEDVPELEKWFGAKLNRKLAVPNLSTQGFTAQGGRLVIINGKPAAQFLYSSDKSELVELVIAFTDAPYMPAQSAQRGDVNIVHWRDNGYAYAFAGAIDTSRLQALADRVWRELARSS
jgi:anti-sigma factor RsiW